MPAPFDDAHIIAVHLNFVDVNVIVAGFAKDWSLLPWAFPEMVEAKEEIDLYFKIKDWMTRPESTIEWSYAVVYAGYETEDIPYKFGTKVTLAIIPKEMIYPL